MAPVARARGANDIDRGLSPYRRNFDSESPAVDSDRHQRVAAKTGSLLGVRFTARVAVVCRASGARRGGHHPEPAANRQFLL
jgi:hypothetical protein